MLITTTREALPRTLAICRTLARSGLSATPLVRQQGGDHMRTVEKNNALLALDPSPEDLDSIEKTSCRKACLYTALYSAAPSAHMADRHEQNGIPALWERVRPALAGRGIAPIVLPAEAGLRPTETTFELPLSKPVAGIMTPPLEMEEALQVQSEYMRLKAPGVSLAFFRPSDSWEELSKKVLHTTIWYVPECQGAPAWSFELSCILLSGGSIACATPLPSLKRDVTKVDSLADAIDAAKTKQAIRPPRMALGRELENNFIKTIEESGLYA